jgi:peptide/nickel transport system substrate-binding protein
MNAELKVIDWPASVQMQEKDDKAWNFFFTGYGTNTALGGVAAMRFHAPPFNTYRPKNNEPDADFVAAFNDITNGVTLADRQKAFVRAQARFMDQVLGVPFGSLTKVQAVRSNVDGFRPFRIPRFSNVSITN